MRHVIDKNILIKNFSRHAATYDRYANIQQMMARELAKRLSEKNISNILEIGCGTGNYTSILKNRYKSASMTIIDISAEMIRIAKAKLRDERISFIADDAEEILPDDRFDLITSNATFQWFADLDRAMRRYKAMLTPKGMVAFSIFGPRTFWELAYSLTEALKISGHSEDVRYGYNLISAHGFLGKNVLDLILKREFKNTNIEELTVKERYDSLLELLNKIKYTGASGQAQAQFLWKKSLIQKAEDAYMAHFGGIETSYQIFFCKGAGT